ncbi:MAG TPA: STAS domain-containing protein [Terracidiphilus sp.]|jgi:anti-anti-sigma regulatory factor|nr:STAS domain-containing protein [Terracidiphilus sp.]
MSVDLRRDGECYRIQLDGAIDISCASDLKTSLLQALETKQEVCVSLEGVTELDVTAVQLLWAAGRDAKQRGLGFSITEPPEPICQSVQEMGLELPAITPCQVSG